MELISLFQGFQAPFEFPHPQSRLHFPISVSQSLRLSLSLSLSHSLSLSKSLCLSPFLCWDPVGLTFYYSLVLSQLSFMVSISSPLWPLTST